MTTRELNAKYFAVSTSKHKKGVDKGYKVTYKVRFNPAYTPAEYLSEYEETDPIGCGLFLCQVEFNDLTADRWWDVPTYREEHLTTYRRKITAIKKRYGLTNADVKKFMRVV